MSGEHKCSDTTHREEITAAKGMGPLISSMAGSKSANVSALGSLSTKWFGLDS